MAFSNNNIYKFKTIQNLKSSSYWLIPISYWPVFGINQLVDCIVRLTFVLTVCSTTKPSSLTSHMVNFNSSRVIPAYPQLFATLETVEKILSSKGPATGIEPTPGTNIQNQWRYTKSYLKTKSTFWVPLAGSSHWLMTNRNSTCPSPQAIILFISLKSSVFYKHRESSAGILSEST